MSEPCPFCARLERQEWNYLVGPGVVAFEPLHPVTSGHVLIVPLRHLVDATTDPDWTGLVMAGAARYAKSMEYDCNLITSVGSQATQTVFHLHVHVVPRRQGDGLHLPWTPCP